MGMKKERKQEKNERKKKLEATPRGFDILGG